MGHASPVKSFPWNSVLAALAPPLFAAVLSAAAGCASVAIAGASQGIEYTITNVAYRTFTVPLEPVRTAVEQSLRKMQIQCPKGCSEKIPKGFRMKARTEDLDITVTATKVTPKATKVAVDARKNVFLKDKAVAFEVINQIGLALGVR